MHSTPWYRKEWAMSAARFCRTVRLRLNCIGNSQGIGLGNSFQAYLDYLQQAKMLDCLGQVISAIDNYAEE